MRSDEYISTSDGTMNLFDTDQPIVGDVARVHLLERVLALAAEKADGRMGRMGTSSIRQHPTVVLLDVGCGTGDLWLPLLGHENLEFWGIDIDPARIERAAERFGRERASVLNAYDLASHFSDQRFDVVVSTQTLMLFRRLDCILEGIHAVLKPGGRLLFSIGWTKYRPHDQVKRQIRGFFDERYYMRRYDEHEIERLLRQAGFRLDHVRFGTIDVLKAIHNDVIGEENRNRMLQHWKAMEDVLVRDPHFVEKGKKYCLTIYFEAVKEG